MRRRLSGGGVVLPVLPGPRARRRASDGRGGAAAGGPGPHRHGRAVPGGGPSTDRDRRTRPGRLRSATVIGLLLHNALRVDEVLGADIADLGTDRGHQVLTVLGKGQPAGQGARSPRLRWSRCTPTSTTVPPSRPPGPAWSTGRGAWRGMAGPLLATTSGGRMRPSQLWELVRRLAAAAGTTEWDRLSAHSLRHTGITLASMPGSRCVTCRTTRGTATPAPRGATTTPATASTAPPLTPPPTSADSSRLVLHGAACSLA